MIQYKVPSSDPTKKPYTVTNDDGVWSCGCLGWTRHMPRKDCRHIREKKGEAVAVAVKVGKLVPMQPRQPRHILVAGPGLASAVLMADRPVETSYMPELLERVDLPEGIRLLKTGLYMLQEKMNGYRLQVRKNGKVVTGYNKKGKAKPVPPVVAAEVLKMRGDFLMDGELVGGAFVAHDLLEQDHNNIGGQPYSKRFATLGRLVGVRGYIKTNPTWDPADGIREMLVAFTKLYDNRCEGAVLKLKTAPYKAGRNGQHKKVKFWKTGSFVVLQVRPEGKDSIEIGLYDGKKLVSVGRCTTIGKKKAKGVKVGCVVEIRYLYATADHQVYSTDFIEVRDDVDAAECTLKAQLIYEKNVA